MTNKVAKARSQEQIPELIEMILPIWEQEIIRMQQATELSPAELAISIKLVQTLTTTYLTYRALKAEVKREMSFAPSPSFAQILATERAKLANKTQ